jgi:glycosyltransferase involved in cell wall biosynthesis
MTNNNFVVVIPSYQNKEYCRKNLLSILNQDYPRFRIIYTDDCSTDGTAEEVEKILDQYDINKKTTLVKNNERLFPLRNMYNMVSVCDDNEIVVVVDGDDWLPHSNVLRRVDEEYQKGAWITYGQYRSSTDNVIGCSRQIPQYIIDSNGVRNYGWCSSHLRTYYAWLFKKIKVEDMMIDGKWIEMAGDLAAMFPMLEMAGSNQAFIPDVLYTYNSGSVLNESKVNINLQQGTEMKIRAMRKYNRI